MTDAARDHAGNVRQPGRGHAGDDSRAPGGSGPALDLPLKVLVWDDAGQTKVTYVAPAALGARYQLSADLTAKLAGIDPLTDALIVP